MSKKDKVVINSKEFEYLKKIIEESNRREEEAKKREEELKKMIEELKTQNQNKKQKRKAENMMDILKPLHEFYFSHEWSDINEELRILYLSDETVVFTIREFNCHY